MLYTRGIESGRLEQILTSRPWTYVYVHFPFIRMTF